MTSITVTNKGAMNLSEHVRFVSDDEEFVLMLKPDHIGASEPTLVVNVLPDGLYDEADVDGYTHIMLVSNHDRYGRYETNNIIVCRLNEPRPRDFWFNIDIPRLQRRHGLQFVTNLKLVDAAFAEFAVGKFVITVTNTDALAQADQLKVQLHSESGIALERHTADDDLHHYDTPKGAHQFVNLQVPAEHSGDVESMFIQITGINL